MNHALVHRLAGMLGAIWLCALAAHVQAAPVTSRFAGTVTGYEFGFLDPAAVALDNDHPLGTSVTWDLTYDDAFLGLDLQNLLALGHQPASGTLTVGSQSYTLTGFDFLYLQLGQGGSVITSYGPQVRGTGPATSDGASFFGLFFNWDTDLALARSPMVGFGYASEWATTYGYLQTEGSYSLEHAGSVPEPASALLALPALWWLRRRHAA